MGQRPWLFIVTISALLLAACGSARDNTSNSGARLLQDVTLAPTTPAPTRELSATPQPIVIPVSTSEQVSPLEVVTLQADFILVTPTLPPTKTPTQTPTLTQTPTVTPTPSVTVTATATSFLFPTSVIVPVTAIVASPLQQICDSTWFFIQPQPPSCPLSPPTASQGSFQQFQNGYMIWVGQQDAIYVMYDTANVPRWQVFNDQYDEGMPEIDPAYAQAPPYTWQPRRGFGILWRTVPEVRQRIGWAVIEWETPYSPQVQVAADGSIFISDARGGIFSLAPNGADWDRYVGYGGF